MSKLTSDELGWIEEFQALLSRMPDTLGLRPGECCDVDDDGEPSWDQTSALEVFRRVEPGVYVEAMVAIPCRLI